MRLRQTIRADGSSRLSRTHGLACGLGVVLCVITLSLFGCRGRDKAPYAPLPKGMDPREAALALFQGAQTGRTSPEDIKSLVRLGESARERAGLFDLLAKLKGTTQARIVGLQEIDPARAAVDLSIALPGGGRADYTVHTGREDDGSWRVTAILGPDATWPPAPASSGEGLSTSSPPASAPPR